jgi:hypothetical protein
VANALAYYDTATITAIKSFVVQAPGVNFTTLSNRPDKLEDYISLARNEYFRYESNSLPG